MSDLITVLVPCRNEEGFIANCLDSILGQSVGKERLQILVADGMSDDGTRPIIAKYVEQHDNIVLIDNPMQTVPFALNLGLEQTEGNTVVRVDVHSIYPVDYIEKLIHWQAKLGAENVGGVWDIHPANDSLEARAVAKACSHPFGAGNAEYRVGASEPVQVDTVPFGCYKKSVFDEIGVFDEELTRNQDDEFNGRLINSGGKIFLIPDVAIKYFARPTIQKLAKMYYQYGLFKPLVLKKLGSPATLRQLVPVTFVFALLGLLLLSLFISQFSYLFLLLAVTYVGASALAAVLASKEIASTLSTGDTFKFRCLLAGCFASMHFSYGCGYLQGILKFMIMRQSGASIDKILPSR